jgi:hypothetical protein
MLDKELLDLKLGGVVMRDMTAITFLQYVANKVSGAPAYRAETQELLSAVSAAPMSRKMSDEQKISLIRKLQALDIPIP